MVLVHTYKDNNSEVVLGSRKKGKKQREKPVKMGEGIALFYLHSGGIGRYKKTMTKDVPLA